MKIGGKLYLGLIMVFTLMTFVYAAPNMQEGEWENTMEIKMDIPGMPYQMQPMSFKTTSCITKEDLVPQTAQKDQNCKVLEQKVAGNKVSWKVKCMEKDATSIGEGEITYNGNSYKGTLNTKITNNSSGQTIASTAKMSGRRLGPCKK